MGVTWRMNALWRTAYKGKDVRGVASHALVFRRAPCADSEGASASRRHDCRHGLCAWRTRGGVCAGPVGTRMRHAHLYPAETSALASVSLCMVVLSCARVRRDGVLESYAPAVGLVSLAKWI